MRRVRTDPDEPDSSIRLLPWVFDGEALTGLPYAAQRLSWEKPELQTCFLLCCSLGVTTIGWVKF